MLSFIHLAILWFGAGMETLSASTQSIRQVESAVTPLQWGLADAKLLNSFIQGQQEILFQSCQCEHSRWQLLDDAVFIFWSWQNVFWDRWNVDYLSFCFTTDNVRKIRHVRCMETSDIYARIWRRYRCGYFVRVNVRSQLQCRNVGDAETEGTFLK